MYRRWCQLAILIVLFTPRTAAQPAGEREVRALALRFFSAYAGRDPAPIPSIVSRRSPHRAELLALAEAPAGSVPSAIDAQISVGRIRIDGARATAQVFVEIAGPASSSSTAAERLLLCSQEGEHWRVWRVAPSIAELVDAATAAPSRTARRDLLGPDAEWLGPELWPPLVARGDRLFQRGRYTDAGKAYEAAVDVAQATGERSGLVAAVRGLGHVRLYAGDLDAALAAYEQSLDLARRLDLNREILRALNGVGNVRAAQKRIDDALRAYDEGLRLAESIGDQAGIALALNNIANVEVTRERYDAALARYQRALAIKEQVGDGAAISIGAYNIGRVLFLQGNYHDALRYQQRSLELALSLERKAGIASVHRSLAETHDRLGDHARALHHYQSSLEVAVQIGDRATALDDLLSIARLWRVREERQFAIAALKRALELLGPNGTGDRRAQVMDELTLAQETSETASPDIAGAEALLARNRVVEAWAAVERGRASTLSGLVPPATARGGPTARRRGGTSPAAIGYLVSNRHVHLFVFPARRDPRLGPARHVAVKVDRRALTQSIDRHCAALQRGQPSPDARTLYRLLIAPVERELRSAGTVRIVPDGALWALPFESLQQADGSVLIQQHAVFYSLFAMRSAAADDRLPLPVQSGGLLAIGRDVPITSSHPWLTSLVRDGHIPVASGTAEAHRVTAAYEPSRRMALEEDAATESAVANAAPDSRVLHLAAVSRFDDFDPLHSGQLLAPSLADDGVLTPPEVANLRISADAVLLPSVWLTSGAPHTGRALQVQSWAWRLAGAANLIVGRWAMDPVDRGELLDELHRALARPRGPRRAQDAIADALRRVQLAWLAQTGAGRARWVGMALVSDD